MMLYDKSLSMYFLIGHIPFYKGNNRVALLVEKNKHILQTRQ